MHLKSRTGKYVATKPNPRKAMRYGPVLSPKPVGGKYQRSPRILRIIRRVLEESDRYKIAKEFGVSRNYVDYVCMEAEMAGLLAALKRRMPLEKRRERIAQILEMERLNYAVPLIARKLALSKVYVYAIIGRHRLKMKRIPLAKRQPRISIEVIADLLKGIPRTEIARHRNVSIKDIGLIQEAARRAGIEFAFGPGLSSQPRKFSHEMREFVAAVAPLLTAKEISKALKMPVSVVQRTARRHGVKCRLSSQH
jgi:transposase